MADEFDRQYQFFSMTTKQWKNKEKKMSEQNTQAAITTQDQNKLQALIGRADGTGFLRDIRIKSRNSEIPGNVGSIVLGSEKILTQGYGGSGVKVFCGPWRYQAIRFRGKGVAPDIKSYNLTADSQFIDGQWQLNNPDLRIAGIFTPDYLVVMIGALLGDSQGTNELIAAVGQEAYDVHKQRAVADNGLQVRNLVGYSSLLYIPDTNEFGIYFISGQAKTQTSVWRDLQRFQNQVGFLSSKEGKGQYKPAVPEFRPSPGEAATWPNQYEEVFNKFLYESVDAVVDPNARPR